MDAEAAQGAVASVREGAGEIGSGALDAARSAGSGAASVAGSMSGAFGGIADAIPDISFPSSDVADFFSDSWDAVEDVARAVLGLSGIAFNFVLYDIFRDFFQIISIFLSKTPIPDAFERVFGRISFAISIDFDVPTVRVSEAGVFLVLCFFILILILYGTIKARQDPDRVRDGAELVDWEERSKALRLRLQIVWTVVISLYAPIVERCVEVFVCRSNVETRFERDESFGDNCSGDLFNFSVLVAVVTMLVLALFVPYKIYKIIQKNKPELVLHDDLGRPIPPSSEVYARSLETDKSPYKFLYRGYERRWAYYKVIVMILKALLIAAVIVVPLLTGNAQTVEDDSDVATAIVVVLLLMTYMFISFRLSPFLKSSDDYIDRSARVTSVVTAVIGFIAVGGVWRAITLNIVHSVNAVIMLGFVVVGSTFFRKKVQGMLGIITYPRIAATYDAEGEIRKLIWFPFWDSLLLSDRNAYSEYSSEAD